MGPAAASIAASAFATRVDIKRWIAMSYLVQILLPTIDNEKKPYAPGLLRSLVGELTTLHGGATAYLRSPGTGLWKDESSVVEDTVVAVEVLVRHLDRRWWRRYRKHLQEDLNQQEIMMRATKVKML
jgi:hypothetical protein